jgi:hypothetical protein
MNIIPTVPHTQLRLNARQLLSEDQTDEAWEKNAVLNIGELRRENYEYFHISPEILMYIFAGLSPQMTGFDLQSVMWNLWWNKMALGQALLQEFNPLGTEFIFKF